MKFQACVRLCQIITLILVAPACSDGQEPIVSQVLSLSFVSTTPGTRPDDTVTTHLVLEPSSERAGIASLHAYGAHAEGAYTLISDTLVVSFPGDEFEGTWLPTSASTYCPNVFSVETLTLEVTREGGRIVSVQGDGRGARAYWLRNDAPSANEYTFTVAQVEGDATSIELNASGAVHPLTALEARVSAPSSVEGLLLRRSGSEAVVDTMERTSGTRHPVTGDVITYQRVGTAPFAWGATYTIAADPADTDAFGRAIGAASFTIAPAPAFFDAPGFEGDVRPQFYGSARISNATDVGFAQPHEGTGALMLGSDGTATLVFESAEPAMPTELIVRARYAAFVSVVPPLSLRFFDDTEVVSMQVTPAGSVPTDGTVIETLTVSLPEFARTGAFSLELASRNYGEACGYNPIRRGEIVIEELRLQ